MGESDLSKAQIEQSQLNDQHLERVKARTPAPAPLPEKKQELLRAPIRTEQAIPDAVWYQPWVNIAGAEVPSLMDRINDGSQHLTQETQTCPRAGQWFSNHLQQTIYVAQGQPMPGPELSANGNAVSWVWQE